MLFKILIKSTRNENTVLESMFSKQKNNPIFLKMSSTVTIIFHRKLQSCFVFVFVFFTSYCSSFLCHGGKQDALA